MAYRLEHYDGVQLTDQLIFADSIPDDFFPDGISLRFSELYDRFASHAWGVYQAAQEPRYAAVWPFDAENNYQAMHDDLGDRIHPVRHNLESHGDLQAFMLRAFVLHSRPKYEASPHEITGTRLGVVYHDTGECKHPDLVKICEKGVVGDIPRGQKTQAHRDAERGVLEAVFDRKLHDVPDNLKEFALRVITHDPEVKDSVAHRLYEASHEWGEYETGLQAGRIALAAVRAGEDSHRIRQLSDLAFVVVPKVYRSLEHHSKDFPFIEQMAEAHAALHDRIVSELQHQAA